EGSYFSVLGQIAEVVPPEIRKIISALDPGLPPDSIEKRVENDVTRISLFVPVDGAVRWNQVLDGVEGRLVLDCTRASSAPAEGAENLERALRRTASTGPSGPGEVLTVALIAAPRLVATRLLSANNLPRLDVWSLMAEAHCARCDAQRTVMVAIADHA